MRSLGFWVYNTIWALGSALVGFVIGASLGEAPNTSVSSILLVTGVLLLLIAFAWARRISRRWGRRS